MLSSIVFIAFFTQILIVRGTRQVSNDEPRNQVHQRADRGHSLKQVPKPKPGLEDVDVWDDEAYFHWVGGQEQENLGVAFELDKRATSTKKTTATSTKKSTATSTKKSSSTTTKKSTSTSTKKASSTTKKTSTASTKKSLATSTSSKKTSSTNTITTSTKKASTSTSIKKTTSTKKVSTTSTKKSSSSTAKVTSTSKKTSTTQSTTTTKVSSTSAVKSTSTSKSTASSTKSTSTTTKVSSSTTQVKSSALVSTLSTSVVLSNASVVILSSSSTVTTSCAPIYTASLTISGTGTLPKPTSFVVRSGSNGLSLDGKTFRIFGPNIYWLGLDENVVPKNSYPNKGRVKEALAIAVAMGANTIRSLTLGVNFGTPESIEPSLNTFNESAFEPVDYAIAAAREYGLRVIITLCDDYDYYHGGKYTFLRWNNVTTDNYGNAFFTDRAVIDSYKTYIQHFITHVNNYTGVSYNSDPTIIAWETGNEWGAYIGREGYPPLAWTNEISAFIKQLAPLQLTIDGTDGIWNYTTKVAAPGLNSTTIDVASDHLYPLNSGLLNQDYVLLKTYNKSLLIGEFDWTEQHGGQNLTDFITQVESSTYTGDMLWSVFGHDAQCCAFVTHNDGYSLYYPNGNSAALQSNILKVVQHWYRSTNRTVPSALPVVSCPQPKIVYDT